MLACMPSPKRATCPARCAGTSSTEQGFEVVDARVGAMIARDGKQGTIVLGVIGVRASVWRHQRLLILFERLSRLRAIDAGDEDVARAYRLGSIDADWLCSEEVGDGIGRREAIAAFGDVI